MTHDAGAVGAVLLIWLMCYLFAHISAIPQYVKDVVFGVVLVLMLLVLFGVIKL